MSLELTQIGRQALIAAFFTPDLYVAVPTLHVAWMTEVPVSNMDGSQLMEPDTVNGYGRPAIAMNSNSWAPTGFGEIFNALTVPFPGQVLAPWGLILGMALVDTDVVGQGNVYVIGNVVEPFSPDVGTTPQVSPSDIVIGLYEVGSG